MSSVIKFVFIRIFCSSCLYFRCGFMILKGRRKAVGNCVVCGSMYAGNTQPISAKDDDSTSGVAPSQGGEGTTAPIHPAGSGPGLPLHKPFVFLAGGDVTVGTMAPHFAWQ